MIALFDNKIGICAIKYIFPKRIIFVFPCGIGFVRCNWEFLVQIIDYIKVVIKKENDASVDNIHPPNGICGVDFPIRYWSPIRLSTRATKQAFQPLKTARHINQRMLDIIWKPKHKGMVIHPIWIKGVFFLIAKVKHEQPLTWIIEKIHLVSIKWIAEVISLRNQYLSQQNVAVLNLHLPCVRILSLQSEEAQHCSKQYYRSLRMTFVLFKKVKDPPPHCCIRRIQAQRNRYTKEGDNNCNSHKREYAPFFIQSQVDFFQEA